MEAHPPPVATVAGSLLATGTAVGLAELYSLLICSRARAATGGHVESLRVLIGDALAVAVGVAFPTVFFLASAVGLIHPQTAFGLAKWTGLLLIAGYGFFAARLTGWGTARSLLYAGAAATIAAALIVFKALIH